MCIRDRYVHVKNGATYKTVKDTEAACKALGYDLPAIDHFEDWKSLQDYLPRLEKATSFKILYTYIIAARSKDFSDGKGWVDPKNRDKQSFLIWDTKYEQTDTVE